MTAEEFMKAVQNQPGFVVVAMQILASGGLEPHVHLVAAIHFKNFIKNNWQVRDPRRIHLPLLVLFFLASDLCVNPI